MRSVPFRDALILRTAALWTVVVWGVFVRNIVNDSHRSTGFKVVHVVLAIVSVIFALAIWAVASRARDRGKEQGKHEGRKEKRPSS